MAKGMDSLFSLFDVICTFWHTTVRTKYSSWTHVPVSSFAHDYGFHSAKEVIMCYHHFNTFTVNKDEWKEDTLITEKSSWFVLQTKYNGYFTFQTIIDGHGTINWDVSHHSYFHSGYTLVTNVLFLYSSWFILLCNGLNTPVKKCATNRWLLI